MGILERQHTHSRRKLYLKAIAHASMYKTLHKRWKVPGKCYSFCIVHISPSHITSPSANVLIMFYSDYTNSAYLDILPSSKTIAGRRHSILILHFALPNVKRLCSVSSKSIGTQDISQWISDCSEQNIKYALCFSKAGFKKQDWQQKQVESLCKQTTLAVLHFPLSGSQLFWKSSKQNGIVAPLLSKQHCPCMSASLPAASQLLMAYLSPCNLPSTFLRLLLGYKSAVDAIAFCIHRQLPGKQLRAIDLSLGSNNGSKILLFGLCAVDYFKCK